MAEVQGGIANGQTRDPERPTDAKGRVEIEAMTDRELLEETAHNLRVLADGFEAFSKSPMLNAIGGMFGGPGR